MSYQVIFESRNGQPDRRDGWLDYCREEAPAKTMEQAQAWAEREAKALARRMGFETRFRIEQW